jgi:magnesium-transporting ATPase (P-type)
MFASVISATCDWIKERQFLKLKDEINNETVTVYRGAYGTVQSIPIKDLVVGDIVDVHQGDRVPADCVLIEEMNVTVDQSMYYSGETNVEKEQSTYYGHHSPNGKVDNHTEHPDPFLLVDSKIMTGSGKAIICAVGENTLLARNRHPDSLVLEEQQTHLEKKLDVTANQISKFALMACILSVATQLLFLLCLVLFNSDESLFSNNTLLKIGKIAIVAVVILIVAIPEGLPLAVSIAMALSINALKQDEILIKNLESVQTCAMLHDICVGKTGCLTKGKMTVAKYQICKQTIAIDNDRDNYPDTFNDRLEIPIELKEIIKECIVSNTDVRIECNDEECKYEPMGQPLEVGLIQFLIDNLEDINSVFVDRNKYSPKLTQIPFDQTLKRKIVVR